MGDLRIPSVPVNSYFRALAATLARINRLPRFVPAVQGSEDDATLERFISVLIGALQMTTQLPIVLGYCPHKL